MKYTESHEWIDVKDNIGTVGISDHAQKELGEIVYVELPQIDKKVNGNDEVAVLESTKAAADVYSPISGTIVEVNIALSTQPDLVNKSPEEEGWIYRIKLDNLKELDVLIDEEVYKDKWAK